MEVSATRSESLSKYKNQGITDSSDKGRTGEKEIQNNTDNQYADQGLKEDYFKSFDSELKKLNEFITDNSFVDVKNQCHAMIQAAEFISEEKSIKLLKEIEKDANTRQIEEMNQDFNLYLQHCKILKSEYMKSKKANFDLNDIEKYESRIIPNNSTPINNEKQKQIIEESSIKPKRINNQEFLDIKIPDSAQRGTVDNKLNSNSSRKSPKGLIFQSKAISDDILIKIMKSYAMEFSENQDKEINEYLKSYLNHLQALFIESDDVEEDFYNYQELDTKTGNRIDKKQIEEFFVDKTIERDTEIRNEEDKLLTNKEKYNLADYELDNINDESNIKEKTLKDIMNLEVEKYTGAVNMNKDLSRYYWNMLLEKKNAEIRRLSQEKENLEKVKTEYEEEKLKWENERKNFEDEIIEWGRKEKNLTYDTDEIQKYKIMLTDEISKKEKLIEEKFSIERILQKEREVIISLKKENSSKENEIGKLLKEKQKLLENYEGFDKEKLKLADDIKTKVQYTDKLALQIKELQGKLDREKSNSFIDNEDKTMKIKELENKVNELESNKALIDSFLVKIKGFNQLRADINQEKVSFEQSFRKQKNDITIHVETKRNEILERISNLNYEINRNSRELELKYDKLNKDKEELLKKQFEFDSNKKKYDDLLQQKKQELETGFKTLSAEKSRSSLKCYLILICLAIMILSQVLFSRLAPQYSLTLC